MQVPWLALHCLCGPMLFAWSCLSLSAMAAQPLLHLRAVCAALVESPSYGEPIREVYRVLWMIQ